MAMKPTMKKMPKLTQKKMPQPVMPAPKGGVGMGKKAFKGKSC